MECLEFFSGIGGLRFALELSRVQAKVVRSFDVNEVANGVYKHNFGEAPSTKSIETLTPQDIDRYKASGWLLSPPCQPYTRGGKELDDQDSRAQGLLHLVNLLRQIKCVPTYLFLENVPGFDTSRSRQILLETLFSLGFCVDECLLTPLQFGIPNDRKRYYLMAKRIDTQASSDPWHDRLNTFTEWPIATEVSSPFPIAPLRNYLDESGKEEEYKVPDAWILKRHNFRFDFVKATDRRCACFTKAYGSHHLMSSGSLLQTRHLEFDQYDFAKPESLLDLGIRFFTPTEIARLHAFPIKDGPVLNLLNNHGPPTQAGSTGPRPYTTPSMTTTLEFPCNITKLQRYRLLGNSLNCWVVSELMRCVLFKSGI